jgi:hypothetical protein
VTTNPAAPGETPNDALIRGIAVMTIVPSSSSMKKHAATSSAMLRARLSIDWSKSRRAPPRKAATY